MLDFFAIFTRGGLVLWYISNTRYNIALPVNDLIKSTLLEVNSKNDTYTYNNVALKYKLDNEFELVFVVGYQKLLQLSYVDKLLDSIHLEFRNKYRTKLERCGDVFGLVGSFAPFESSFKTVLMEIEESNREEARKPKEMRSFEDSQKSKKTVASMIVNNDTNKGATQQHSAITNKKSGKKPAPATNLSGGHQPESNIPEKVEVAQTATSCFSQPNSSSLDGDVDSEIERNKQKLLNKMSAGGKKTTKTLQATKQDSSKSSPNSRKGKQAQNWSKEAKGAEAVALDYSLDSNGNKNGVNGNGQNGIDASRVLNNMSPEELADLQKHLNSGAEIRDIEVSEESDVDGSDDEEDSVEQSALNKTKQSNSKLTAKSTSRFGFNFIKSLVGSKTLTSEDLEPVLERMKTHLMTKNVAAEISIKLCESVAAKLQGKTIGTFERIQTVVNATLVETCTQLLEPKRRVDILREVVEAKSRGSPYVIVFCGVNGVGKSTNLAKIAFWLTGQSYRVLIAACDTFRSGAVEQLRTHVHKLNSIHKLANAGKPQQPDEDWVSLYDKGYGKDAAGVAMEAIGYAKRNGYDVVLVDTAGRMQDNEPLMRALTKLITVNQPDLVLFVGEALVGNDAVDQLVKFNKALADFSSSTKPRLIDGIVLTKFDTVDDKIGAAISMTYVLGRPIVFVGTGQTYKELKRLSVPTVVKLLMK